MKDVLEQQKIPASFKELKQFWKLRSQTIFLSNTIFIIEGRA
jgi:hypothetical protein